MTDAVSPMTLAEYNAASEADALALTLHWCAAPEWAQATVDERPFASLALLEDATARHWQHASRSEKLQAFAAHPTIGDVDLLRSRYAGQANKEQGQVLDADPAVLDALAAGNLRYRERHNFTFIVFATGKSARAMLELLEQRIDNTTEQEIELAAAEQLKIMQLRLRQSVSTIPSTDRSTS